MPIPIEKVKDQFTHESQQIGGDGLDGLLQFLQINPYSILGNIEKNSTEKKALREVWMTAQSIEGDKMKVSPNISQQDMANLKSKGYITGNESVIEITESGKKVLKEAILEDEESSFTKQASKQLISKNSYDFGKDVLVKVKHPEKFGAKYISISKKSFAKKNMIPMKIESYKIATKRADGSLKELSDYSDKELVAVLHLTKKIIKNASALALQTQKKIPVHRLTYFAEIIMGELNRF